MAEIWMFSSAKGGVGKTFVATNLGIGLSKIRKRILVVDLDLSTGNLHTFFGNAFSGNNLGHYIDGVKNLSEVTKKSSFVDCDYIQSVPKFFEDHFGDYKKSAQLIADLRVLPYDYIILDTSTTVSQTNLNLVNLVDKVFVITTPELASLERTHHWFDYAMEKKVDSDHFNILINFCRTDRHNSLGFVLHSVLAKKFGFNCGITGHLPFDNAAWQASMSNQNLFKTFPSSTICHEIYRFSKQFIDSEHLRAVS
jgi:flagellar biosynthesis protein FlhG